MAEAERDFIKLLMEALGDDVQVVTEEELHQAATVMAIKDIYQALNFLVDEDLDTFISNGVAADVPTQARYLVPLMDRFVGEFIRPAMEFAHEIETQRHFNQHKN